MAINDDLKAKYTTDLGYTGALTDLEYAWLKAKAGVVAGPIPDMWNTYLRSLGYSGSIQGMKANLGYPFSQQGGGPPPAPSIPFTYDTNTYFWDMESSNNIVDNIGTPTVSRVVDLIGNKSDIRNYNKQWQPLKVAGGVSFNQSTNRYLTFSLPPTITNGKNGWYVAFVLTPTTATNGVVMSISRAVSTANSRMYIDFTGSRNIRLRFGSADNSTLATLFTSVALTLGQKYAIEVLFDFDLDTYVLWINGVNQNVAVTGGPWSNFPSTNPLEVLVGNFTSGGLSLDAVLNNIVFQNGVPSNDIITSVSAFEQVRRAA